MSPIHHAHGEPVWRDRADSILQVKISFEGTDYWEQLWARHIDADVYEICCIPVFSYNLSLGDHVEAPGYVIERVIKRSGRYTFRAWFDPEQQVASRDDVMTDIQRRGHLFEWHSPALVALDADSSESAQALADLLSERERRGELEYETGLEGPPEGLDSGAQFSRLRPRRTPEQE